MRSPRLTVSAAKQAFDALRGTEVQWVSHGSGSAMTAMTAARAVAALPIAGVLAGVLASNGAVVTSRCITRSR